MKRIRVILTCACVFAITYSMFQGVAYAVISNYICWNNSGDNPCSRLSAIQCAVQGGGPCVHCTDATPLFAKTCTAAYGYNCTNTAATMNCGPKKTGTCFNSGTAWSCINLQPAGTCTTVREC